FILGAPPPKPRDRSRWSARPPFARSGPLAVVGTASLRSLGTARGGRHGLPSLARGRSLCRHGLPSLARGPSLCAARPPFARSRPLAVVGTASLRSLGPARGGRHAPPSLARGRSLCRHGLPSLARDRSLCRHGLPSLARDRSLCRHGLPSLARDRSLWSARP